MEIRDYKTIIKLPKLFLEVLALIGKGVHPCGLESAAAGEAWKYQFIKKE